MLLVYNSDRVSTELFSRQHPCPCITFRRTQKPHGCNMDDDDLLLDDVADFGVYTSLHNHLEISDDSEPNVNPVYSHAWGESTRRTATSGKREDAAEDLFPQPTLMPSAVGRDGQPLQLHRAPMDDDTELINLDVLVVAEKSPRRGFCDRVVRGYSWFLTYFPYIPIIVPFIMLCVFAGVSYKFHPPPDFTEDPTAGFETRGTYIRKAMSTSGRFYRAIMSHRGLAYRPVTQKVMEQFGFNGSIGDFGRKKRSTEFTEQVANVFDLHINKLYKDGPAESERKKRSEKLPAISAEAEFGRSKLHRQKRLNDCNCNTEHCFTGFATYVFEPSGEERDLFTAKAMQSICKFNKEIILPKSSDGTVFCPSRSIPEYIATMSNKNNCEDIDDNDMARMKILFEACAIYAVNTSIYANTSMNDLPAQCTRYTMEYLRQIFLYMADGEFFNNNTRKLGELKYSAVYLYGTYTHEDQFYHDHIEGKQFDDGVVKITALRFRNHYNVKWQLLGEYLIEDLMFFGLALVLVFFIMLLYLRSAILMLITIFSVVVSFVTAYFLYFFVFQMKFFPFLNLLALLVLIAVGADDVFVFYDCWEQERAKDPNKPISEIMTKTLSHAALSVFVTSVTTASAFFANTVSSITSIQNFGIFAGISILANFVYMVTLTPAAIVCTEHCYRFYMKSEKFRALNDKVERNIISKLHSVSLLFFERWIPLIVEKTWYIWIIILLLLGVGANVAVFVYPRLQLPVTKDFQVFPRSNLIENWDLTMGNKFLGLVSAEKSSGDTVNFYFIWGLIPNDPGNWMDPNDHGDNAPLIMDQNFDFTKPEVQVFFDKFCKEMIKQPFMQDGVQMTCQLDAITDILKKYCPNPIYRNIVGKCCMTPSVPFDSKTLAECSAAFQLALYGGLAPLLNIKHDSFGDIMGDFVFDNETNAIKAYAISVHSRWYATFAYEQMAEYNKKIMDFFNAEIAKGPPEVKNGFVAYRDWFWFYDLQHALATSTYYSIGLSLAVACIVMLLTSLNVLISIYAMFSICLAIACTVATIVLMGWHLNIIESIIISLAVGLSIDFTIHFGVAYRLSRAQKSSLRTRESFKSVGAAVSMAALTTFIAGSAMMPCRVLPYTKLGIFLMLVMTFSWLYANLFFQSTCHIIGPKGNICQIRFCCGDDSSEEKGDSNEQADAHSMASVNSNDSQLLDS